MDPQLLEAHKAYLKAYKELNKEKIHDSYTKYYAANNKKIKEYQQTYQRGYYERHKEEKKHKQRKYYVTKQIAAQSPE